jgi:Transposase DDE domain
LSGFLDRIKHRYGQANRIWVMDRGIPTEDSLSKMRSIGASYLVGTPKGRLSKLEQSFLSQPWAKVRDGVQVKRLATDEDVYVLAQSDARIGKERGMRRKRLRQVRRREGRYLLRTNLTAQEQEPTDLWRFYIQPTEVEPVFKEIKHDLAIRAELAQPAATEDHCCTKQTGQRRTRFGVETCGSRASQIKNLADVSGVN